MIRGVGTASLVLVLAGPAAAGEILFTNGSRLEGSLSSDVLVVSTGADLIEIDPEQVATLAPGEIHLRDGRVVRGTLVGGIVRATTPLGELAIRADELRLFRADAAPPAPGPAAPTGGSVPGAALAGSGGSPVVTPVAAGVPAPTPLAPAPGGPVAAGGTASRPAPRAASMPGGTPAAAASRAEPAPSPPVAPASAVPGPSAGEPGRSASAPVVAALPPETVPAPAAGRRYRVVVEQSPLYRDAFANATHVGRVVRGQEVTFVDFIDRRLWVFNTLVFDGGYWIKVRAADGQVGWLPASALREIR